jgi:DNA-binding response OmpR family regulator
MPKRILSVSYDPSLLETRQMLLEGSGYTVTSALGFIPAIQHCKKNGYDLFILGHSIPLKDKQELMRTFRENCPAPILSLERSNESRVESDFHASPFHPEEFLATVGTILSGKAARTMK